MGLSETAARLVAAIPSLVESLPDPSRSLPHRVCLHFCEVDVAIETDSEELAVLLHAEYGYAGQASTSPLSTIRIYTEILPYVVIRHKIRVLALDLSAERLVHVGEIDLEKLEIIAGSVSKRTRLAQRGSSAVASCLPVIELVILEVLQEYMPSMLFVHASSVARDATGIVFAGPSGSGKSTTACAFQHLQYRVIADDITAIDLRSVSVWGFPQKQRHSAPSALSAVLHLTGIGDHTALFALTTEQAVREVMRSCLASPKSVVEHYLGLWNLCHGTPSYRAQLGSIKSVAHQINAFLTAAG